MLSAYEITVYADERELTRWTAFYRDKEEAGAGALAAAEREYPEDGPVLSVRVADTRDPSSDARVAGAYLEAMSQRPYAPAAGPLGEEIRRRADWGQPGMTIRRWAQEHAR